MSKVASKSKLGSKSTLKAPSKDASLIKPRSSIKQSPAGSKSAVGAASNAGGTPSSMTSAAPSIYGGKRGGSIQSASPRRSMAKSSRGGSMRSFTTRSMGKSFRSGTPGSERTARSERLNVIMMGQPKEDGEGRARPIPLIIFCVVCVVVVLLIIAVTVGVVLGTKGGDKDIQVNVRSAGEQEMAPITPQPQPILPVTTTTTTTTSTIPTTTSTTTSTATTTTVTSWCSQDAPSCPVHGKCTDPIRGRRYFGTRLARTFDKADEYCKRMGGRLPEPRDKAEYRAIRDYFIDELKIGPEFNYDGFWVGYTDRATEGVWKSLSGSGNLDIKSIPWETMKGHPTNPSNGGYGKGNQDCAVGMITGEDGWDDRSCQTPTSVVACEFDCDK